jgi:hypothetical protein
MNVYSHTLRGRDRHLNKRHNVYDSLSEIDIEEEHAAWYFINPIGLINLIWDSIPILLCLYSLIWSHAYTAFDYNNNCIYFIELLISLLFIPDKLLNLTTSYLEHDNIIYESEMIIRNYLNSGSFILSVISSISYESLISVADHKYIHYINSTRYNK